MSQNPAQKILLVLEATLGGTGRHILDLADGLLSRGLEVHLVYSLQRADIQFREGIASLRGKHQELRELVLPMDRAVTLRDFAVYPRIWRYVRKEGPFHVIHSHSTKAGFLARLLVGTGNAVQIYTPHGLMTQDPGLQGFKRMAVSLLESVLARRTRAIVVVSRTEEKCAERTGINGNLLQSIPNGVHSARLKMQRESRVGIRERLGIPTDALAVGFIGRLCDQKRPAYLVRAFAFLCRNWSRPLLPYLVIVGSGPNLGDLQRLARELRISEQVIWAGPVKGEDHVCAFDILGHTSSFEGFGYVFLEALASGVPIVSTRVGGVAELGIDGKTGLVCDPWNARNFAQLMERLLCDDNLRERLGAQASRTAERFDVERMVDATARLYSSLTAHVRVPEGLGTAKVTTGQ